MRRLLSSFTGSLVVAALVGCNAIVGTEDIEYRDPTDPEQQDPDDPRERGPDTGTDKDRPDAESMLDADAGAVDADSGDGPISDGGSSDAFSD